MGDDQDRARLRALYRAHYTASAARHAEWVAGGYQHPPPPSIPFPDELRGLSCGARTRAGTPCKITAIYMNGRCRLHGGLSTGPTTPEGKARAALNGRSPKRKGQQTP